jgi:hypothetical protein
VATTPTSRPFWRDPVYATAGAGALVLLVGIAIQQVKALPGAIVYWAGWMIILSAGVGEMMRKRRERAQASKKKKADTPAPEA